MQLTTIGLDIAKNVFHVIGLNQAHTVCLKKKLSRSKVLSYFAQLPRCRVVLEACGGSHYWGRQLQKLGHDVKLLSPRAVKAYVQGNKNDYNDALAIAEASNRPRLRFISVKTTEQHDLQSLHRLRASVVRQRTEVSNRIRGLLAEYGIVIRKGLAPLRQSLPVLISDETDELSGEFKCLLVQAYEQLCQLDEHIHTYDRMLARQVKANEDAQRLMSTPGFGPVLSSVFISAIGDGQGFRRGRDVSAFLGLVPRQHSTGGKPLLLGISKRGDGYLRGLLIHGARSVVKHAERKTDPFSQWINQLVQRRGKNKATVALANKLARIGWAVLTSGKTYQSKLG